MAKKTFFDIINGVIEIGSFNEWLSGKDTQNISPDLNRAEFSLYVLNYIQKETNKYLHSESSINSKTTSIQQDDPTYLQSKEEQQIQTSEKCQRTPFKVTITDQTTPTKSNKPLIESFSHTHINQIMIRPKNVACNSSQANMTENSRVNGLNILTSTPRSQLSNPLYYSPDTSSSVQSNNSSPSFTPPLRWKGNTSGGSQRVSPASNSPSFSPMSPKYSDSFPDLGSRGRHRPSQSSCLGDYILAKPAPQKNRRRIKPSQLTSVLDKDSINGSSKGSNKLEPRNHFASIENNYSEVEKSSYEEKSNKLKQKFTEYSNVPIEGLPSKQVYLNGSKLQENASLCVANTSVHRNSPGNPATNLKADPEVVIIIPDPNLVTCLDKIEKLACVYSACMDKNLVPNIISELYFIFTVITSEYKASKSSDIDCTPNGTKREQLSPEDTKREHQDRQTNVKRKIHFTDKSFPIVGDNGDDSVFSSNKDNSMMSDNHVSPKSITCSILEKEPCQQINNSENVLNSVHDCVMFASIVVGKQARLIQYLAKGVIRSLMENIQLLSFTPNVISILSQILKEQEAINSSSPLQTKMVSKSGPTIYQTDTDSKENFSTSEGFYSFTKQRDVFYDILYEWRIKYAVNLWTTRQFPQRVQTLLNMSSHHVNMMHLARLFCAQLTNATEENDYDSELELPGMTKDKLSLLKARFSKPPNCNLGPRPPPQFPAEQQFYQEFINIAKGTTFLTHVVDFLIYRINEIEKTPFSIDGHSPEVSQSLLKGCVSDCCLLAKFLGLIVFSPYTTKEAGSPISDVINAQLLVRKKSKPPVDFFDHLQRALTSNRLVITVPWIVAFLGMMDPVSCLLPCYQPLLQLLVKIYLSLPLPHLSPLSCLLLRSSLGWLFDPSFFPVQVFCSLTSATVELPLSNGSTTEANVDTQNIVDYYLVSVLCPGLSSLQMVLSNSKKDKGVAPRHITPVPALHTPAAPPVTSAQSLELELEESFYNGQAPSFRATIEFVVDRLSSSCIKHICSNVIGPTKEEAAKSFNKNKENKLNKTEVLIEEWCGRIGEQIESVLAEYCGPCLVAVLHPLLGPDASPIVPTAQSICARQFRERVITWLNSHFNFVEMFRKLLTEPNAKIKEDKPDTPSEDLKIIEHRDSAMSPPNIIIKLQDILCACIETGNVLSNEEEILDLFKSITETLSYRKDLIIPSRNMIHKITIDLTIVMLAYNPKMMTPKVMEGFCQIWTISSPEENLGKLLSPRNVLLLCQGGAKVASHSWIQLSKVLVNLLKNALITPLELEGQWIALLELEWPRNVLALFGTCLNSILDKIKRDPVCSDDPKFTLILEWIREMSGELVEEEFPND